MKASWLVEHCPRLARARDAYVVEQRELWRLTRLRNSKLLELQRVVAHRELQLIRAMSKGNGRYIRERQTKLKLAQARLRAVEKKSVVLSETELRVLTAR